VKLPLSLCPFFVERKQTSALGERLAALRGTYYLENVGFVDKSFIGLGYEE
jgi:hypothetical protein